MGKISKFAKLKRKYIHYYQRCPIQKYAASSIGKNEDTIIRWKKEDADFADRVEAAKAEWMREKVKNLRPEFALERLEAEVFGKRSCNHEDDPNYQKFQQFSFIFSLSPDELERFIQAAHARANDTK